MTQQAYLAKPKSTTELESIPRVELLRLWQEVFNTPPPKGLSQVFLRYFLAFELQSRGQKQVARRLQTCLKRTQSGTGRAATSVLKPGGRLLREWNGVTHVIDVTKDGFVWKAQTYRSLSAIAHSITGAHWSGPRFFGLTSKALS